MPVTGPWGLLLPSAPLPCRRCVCWLMFSHPQRRCSAWLVRTRCPVLSQQASLPSLHCSTGSLALSVIARCTGFHGGSCFLSLASSCEGPDCLQMAQSEGVSSVSFGLILFPASPTQKVQRGHCTCFMTLHPSPADSHGQIPTHGFSGADTSVNPGQSSATGFSTCTICEKCAHLATVTGTGLPGSDTGSG